MAVPQPDIIGPVALFATLGVGLVIAAVQIGGWRHKALIWSMLGVGFALLVIAALLVPAVARAVQTAARFETFAVILAIIILLATIGGQYRLKAAQRAGQQVPLDHEQPAAPQGEASAAMPDHPPLTPDQISEIATRAADARVSSEARRIEARLHESIDNLTKPLQLLLEDALERAREPLRTETVEITDELITGLERFRTDKNMMEGYHNDRPFVGKRGIVLQNLRRLGFSEKEIKAQETALNQRILGDSKYLQLGPGDERFQSGEKKRDWVLLVETVKLYKRLAERTPGEVERIGHLDRLIEASIEANGVRDAR